MSFTPEELTHETMKHVHKELHKHITADTATKIYDQYYSRSTSQPITS